MALRSLNGVVVEKTAWWDRRLDRYHDESLAFHGIGSHDAGRQAKCNSPAEEVDDKCLGRHRWRMPKNTKTGIAVRMLGQEGTIASAVIAKSIKKKSRR